MKDKVRQSIDLELMRLTHELNEQLVRHKNRFSGKGLTACHSSYFTELSNLLNSFDQLNHRLLNLVEASLFGGSFHSSNLIFYTDLYLRDISGDLDIINQVENLPEKINLGPYKFALTRLISWVTESSQLPVELKITSLILPKGVQINVCGSEHHLFNGISNALNTVSKASAGFNEHQDLDLMLCYSVLSFYGGNLWSEQLSEGLAKVCFTLPWEECNPRE